MDFNKYQKEALKTVIYPKEIGIWYTTLGINGEAGEVAEKVKKAYRDKNGEFSKETKAAIASEIGGVLWYCAALAQEIGWTLDDVACLNIEQLKSRMKRGKLSGSGDER
jgi:NTP pyrophosphatase (non-canonical NTP hydrolase)